MMQGIGKSLERFHGSGIVAAAPLSGSFKNLRACS
jgi:hypothetical protein